MNDTVTPAPGHASAWPMFAGLRVSDAYLVFLFDGYAQAKELLNAALSTLMFKPKATKPAAAETAVEPPGEGAG